SKSRSSEGWRHYGGSNPHRGHLHVSVGTGPDGKSTGPYDNTSSWGFSGTGSGPGGSTGSATTIGGIMLPREGDKGPDVEFWQRMLLRTGEKLPKYGADAAWGSEMTAAVQSSRKKLGWDPVKSPRITAAHAEQLLLKAFAAKPAPAPAVKRQDSLLLQPGDQGEDVQLMQLMLQDAGEKLSADGVYGDETVAALKSFWKRIKPTESYDGKRATAHVMRELYRPSLKGEKGEQGDRGPAGELTLPMSVKISGVVTSATE